MKKIAFVCSGGGLRGCFQVGALNYLMREKKIIPDIVCGISTGSLQSLAVAQNELDLLNDIWLNLGKESDIYSGNIYTWISALLWGKGFYRFSGLKKKLLSVYDKEKLLRSKTDIFIGVVDLQTAALTYYSKETLDTNRILASCTIPVYFPPIEDAEGKQWVDGGLRDIAPLRKSIIEGATDIYVLLCDPLNYRHQLGKVKNAIKVLERTIDIWANEVLRNDVKEAIKINNLIAEFPEMQKKYRHININVIAPERHFIGVLEVDRVKIRDGMEYGKQRAKEVVS